MDKIIFKCEKPKEMKSKRHCVIVKDDVYYEILNIKNKTGIPVETIVNTLLKKALEHTEIER